MLWRRGGRAGKAKNCHFLDLVTFFLSWSFNYKVDKILHFFDHLPIYLLATTWTLIILYVVGNNWHWGKYPPTPHLVHVVFERPLRPLRVPLKRQPMPDSSFI